MHRSIRYMLAGMALIVPLALAVAEGSAQTPPQPQTPAQPQPEKRFHGVGGSITSVSAGAFVLTDRRGSAVTVRMTSATRLLTDQQAGLADIRAGDVVRIVAEKAQDGTLTARFVQGVASLPQSAPQGRGGMWQSGSGRVMVAGSVTGTPAAGRLAIATANGQTASILVPSTARISRLVSAPLSNLAVGAHVMVRGTPNADGSITAALVLVGRPHGQ